MTECKYVPLTMMKAGQRGRIVEIQGGPGMVNRLSSLGVRQGKHITKISSMVMRGPVTIQIGRTQVAMGFGIAGRVILEVLEAMI